MPKKKKRKKIKIVKKLKKKIKLKPATKNPEREAWYLVRRKARNKEN